MITPLPQIALEKVATCADMTEVGPPNVLIVDDEPAVQRFVCRCLRNAGIRAQGASGVSDALALLRNHTFHLVLCDLRMPDGSGEELLQQSMEIDKTLPVIIMTGAVDEAGKALLMASGARAILTKPVHLSVLIENVRVHARTGEVAP